jgi:hypothetical protein
MVIGASIPAPPMAAILPFLQGNLNRRMPFSCWRVIQVAISGWSVHQVGAVPAIQRAFGSEMKEAQ